MTTTTELHPIFAACCDRFHTLTKADLSTPFIQDGYLYATDARIAVRMPASDDDLTDRFRPTPDRKLPRTKADTVFQLSTHGSKPVPIPDLSTIPPCLTCGGIGTIPGVLAGAGVVRKTVTAECPECGEDLDITAHIFGDECPKCDGSGFGNGYARVPLAPGFEIAANYARLLVRHGVTGVFLPPSAEMPVRFVLDGICEGRLMPLRPE